MLSLLWSQIQPLVGGLRSHKPPAWPKKKKNPATHSVPLQLPLVPHPCNERVTLAEGHVVGYLMSPLLLLNLGKHHSALSPDLTSESCSTLWSRKPPIVTELTQKFHFSCNKLRIFFVVDMKRNLWPPRNNHLHL